MEIPDEAPFDPELAMQYLRDASDQLEAAKEVVVKIRRHLAEAAALCRAEGISVATIAEVLDVTRQRADQLIRSVQQQENRTD